VQEEGNNVPTRDPNREHDHARNATTLVAVRDARDEQHHHERDSVGRDGENLSIRRSVAESFDDGGKETRDGTL
jgi:hypothetical protein